MKWRNFVVFVVGASALIVTTASAQEKISQVTQEESKRKAEKSGKEDVVQKTDPLYAWYYEIEHSGGDISIAPLPTYNSQPLTPHEMLFVCICEADVKGVAILLAKYPNLDLHETVRIHPGGRYIKRTAPHVTVCGFKGNYFTPYEYAEYFQQNKNLANKMVQIKTMFVEHDKKMFFANGGKPEDYIVEGPGEE